VTRETLERKKCFEKIVVVGRVVVAVGCNGVVATVLYHVIGYYYLEEFIINIGVIIGAYTSLR